MAVIALQGTKGVGKTRTYGLLAGQLQLPTSGYAQVPGYYKDLGNNDFIDLYRHPISNKLLGIATQGDYDYWLKTYIDDLFLAQADVVLCACRTAGYTPLVVQSYAPYHLLVKTPSDPTDIAALMALVGLYIP